MRGAALVDLAGKLLAKDAAKLVDRAGRERPVRQLFLLGAVEQVEERNDHRLGSCGAATRPPCAALLELQEVGPLVVTECRLVLRKQPGELRLEISRSVGHRASLLRC